MPLDVATEPNAPRSIAHPPRLFLHFVYPRELAGRVVELSKLVLGRDPGADRTGASEPYASIPHPTVSRRHASVQHGFGVPILADLGSSNGTRVDGNAVHEPTPLVAQSVVRFGDTLAVVEEQAPRPDDSLAALVPGSGPSVVRVHTTLRRAAPEASTLLVLGETGTGKEWLAAALHRLSGRSGPYLKLSCAELAPHLIESELFGHERGAFTGAVGRHTGLFQSAHEGTLFLDEVGELPLELQAKLLRVLQEGEVRPLGSTQTYRTDVRVVSATNRDLSKAVEEGRFRRDLFARISVFEIRLPALRERRQDILPWLERFWEGRSLARGPATASAPGASRPGMPLAFRLQPAVAERLLVHPWLDNLRGLDRLVQRLLAIGEDVTVGMRLLGEVMPELATDGERESRAEPNPAATTLNGSQARPSAPATAPPQSDVPSREEFLAVYEATGRSVRATSKHFARDRRQIYRWLEAYGVERPRRSND
jgi:DNA-binding NtrC family response regulator